MRTIETERLTLREVRESDTQTIFERWASDPEVTRYMTWNPHRSIEDTRMVMDYWLSEYGKDNTYRWVLVPRGEDKPIGIIDVVSYDDGVPVLGYCEGRKYWGQGYMTEALRAVTAALFEDGFTELKIGAVDENKASNRVIQKAGFVYDRSDSVPMSLAKPDIVTINTYRMKKPQ